MLLSRRLVMLGPPKLRSADQPVTVSLEELVPADNFYRHLDAHLDLSWVREWVQDGYADRGRPSIDPVVFFKLQLILFFEGLRSERRLIETGPSLVSGLWPRRAAAGSLQLDANPAAVGVGRVRALL
jgi:hypothetical protein